MAGPIHAEAIASAAYFCGISGARETTVGGGSFCATIDNIIATVTFLIIFEAGVDEIIITAVGDAIFHSHVRGIGITHS